MWLVLNHKTLECIQNSIRSTLVSDMYLKATGMHVTQNSIHMRHTQGMSEVAMPVRTASNSQICLEQS